jgi:hypothetical protein
VKNRVVDLIPTHRAPDGTATGSIFSAGALKAMTEILTGMLVLITAFYAWATYRILQANRDMAMVMKDQMNLQLRPYVQPSLFIHPGTNIFCLRIKNIGRSAASNLRLSLDRDFFQFGEKRAERNLQNLAAFSGRIASFPPDAELEFWLAQGPHLFGDGADDAVTPRVFSITAEYEYSGKAVMETTTLDFRPYLNSDIPRHHMAHELREIGRVLQDLKRTFDELARKMAQT